MKNEFVQKYINNELLTFADEDENDGLIKAASRRNKWKILISDDEEEVHSITRIALKNYIYDDKEIELLHAFSGLETQKIMTEHNDIAIILLDVVMESDSAGLDAVRFIRETIRNSFVRIILRTGQPGKAPEREIITGYDINDYKEKTELTAQKLYTTITSSLRSYRDLRTIEKSRQGLEKIISSTGQLFAHRRLKTFTEGVLTQLASLFQATDDSFFMQASGFAAADDHSRLKIVAGTGQYEQHVGKCVEDVLSDEVKEKIFIAIEKQSTLFIEDIFISYFQTESKSINILYLDGFTNLSSLDKDMIRLFASNVAVAFDNAYLSKEIVDTQKEIIETLMEIVEARSEETANHVHRVAEISYLLAIKAGVPEDEAQLLRMAAPMHDVGKIGIPDAILNKCGKLTSNEYEFIKGHTTIGEKILGKSNRRIIKTAAIIAHQHHERWDGNGYPNQIKADEIHLFGRIVSLADVFDALSHKRTYKCAYEMHEVIQYISESSGTLFDPALVDIFLGHIEEFTEINTKFPDRY